MDCRLANQNLNHQSTNYSDIDSSDTLSIYTDSIDTNSCYTEISESNSSKIDFNAILTLKQISNISNPYILLIGPAGAGKTTLSKRVVLSTFESKRYAFFTPLAFVNPHQLIDLKYLLFCLSMLYFSNDVKVDKYESSVALAWLLSNQHKVTIILD